MLNTVISKLDIESEKDSGKPIHIECPHCKAQYLPGEIYLPGALIGQPLEVVKDSMGKIIYVDYQKVDRMPDRIESFTCEYCEQPFEVEAGYIQYKVKKSDPAKNFKQEYVSLLD